MVNKLVDDTVKAAPVTESVERHFRLLSMPCCKRQLEWIDPRLPTFCPECGSTVTGLAVGCMLYEDEQAALIMHVKREPGQTVKPEQRLGINSRVGMKVRYVPDEADSDRAAFGSNVNPKGLLSADCDYTIQQVDVRSWHTKIWLENDQGPFNSSHFVPA